MTIYQFRKHADEMGVTFRDAALCRLRFIREEMHRLLEQIDCSSESDPMTAIVADIFFGDRFRALAEEQRHIVLALRRPVNRPVSRITPEMIDRARQYPVDRLIQFNHGVAHCFAHEDKRPSMSHWRKGNKASCFVCGKRWDSIGILQERDGLDFKTAVLRLAA